MKTLSLLLPALVLTLPSSVHAGSAVAGSLLVDLKASTYTDGAAWANAGSLSGSFAPSGTTPRKELLDGLVAVVFDGQDRFAGPVASATLTGSGATCSIECWAWNANVMDLELMVEWGRHDAAGGELGFGYGDNAAYGAFTHSSTPEGGWDPFLSGSSEHGAAPAPASWHHLVYTSDGTAVRAYMDGALIKEAPGVIHPLATAILLGQRTGSDGLPLTTQGFTGALHSVRIHSEALTEAQVAANFEEDLPSHYFDPAPSASIRCAPAHRYSFNGIAAGDPVSDSVGVAHGIVKGSGSSWLSGQLALTGGSSATAAYVDFPNGLISGYTDITLEVWATTRTAQPWARILDIGTNSAGDIPGPGGTFSGSGSTWLILSASESLGDRHVFEVAGVPLLHGTSRRYADHNEPGVTHHHAITYSNLRKEWRHYLDGRLVDAIPSASGPPAISDVNVWLGRSNFYFDANFDGWFDEFRVYSCALTDTEILRTFNDGPDILPPVAPPYTGWATSTATAAGVSVHALDDLGADTDHDGYSNVAEYTFGTNPLIPDSGPAITSGFVMQNTGTTAEEYLTISCERPAERTTLPVAECSDDFQTWTSATLVSSVPQPNGLVLDTWRAPEPLAAKTRALLRFSITGTP